MQHADQGKQAPCGLKVHTDLVFESLGQHFGGFVMDTATCHINRFELIKVPFGADL